MGFWSDLFLRDGMTKEEYKQHIKIEEAKADLKKEWKRTHICKKCQKIFSEGYPFEKGFFGGTKSYVCKECAEDLAII